MEKYTNFTRMLTKGLIPDSRILAAMHGVFLFCRKLVRQQVSESSKAIQRSPGDITWPTSTYANQCAHLLCFLNDVFYVQQVNSVSCVLVYVGLYFKELGRSLV